MDYILNYLINPVEVNIKKSSKYHPDRFRPYLFNDKHIDLKSLQGDDTIIKQNNPDYWDINYDDLINLLSEKIDNLQLISVNEYSLNDLIKESQDLSNDVIAKLHAIYQIVDVLIYRSNIFEKISKIILILIAKRENHCLLRNLSVLMIVRILFYISYHSSFKYNNDTHLINFNPVVLAKLIELKSSKIIKLFFLKEELSDYINYYQKIVNS